METKVMERPVATLDPILDEVAFDEYAKLSADLGYQHGVRVGVNLDLRRWLLREEIPMFKYEEVAKYMRHLCNKLMQEKGITYGSNGRIDPVWAPLAYYPNTIPMEVLKLAHRVKTEAPGEKSMFVSYVRELPDPFLMVVPHKVEWAEQLVHPKDMAQNIRNWGKIDQIDDPENCFVIAVWDEPGFKLAPTKS